MVRSALASVLANYIRLIATKFAEKLGPEVGASQFPKTEIIGIFNPKIPGFEIFERKSQINFENKMSWSIYQM